MKKSLPYILASLAFVTFGYILLQNDNRTNPAQIFDSDSLTTLKSDGQIYEKSKFTKTGFTWKDSKGDEFPVYIAHTDSCFIIRTSKSGENYMAYLGEEVSEQIYNELSNRKNNDVVAQDTIYSFLGKPIVINNKIYEQILAIATQDHKLSYGDSIIQIVNVRWRVNLMSGGIVL